MKHPREKAPGSREMGTAWRIEGLGAPGPDPELKARLALFGQFVGDWAIEGRWFRPNGTLKRTGKGEVHFGWILDGRAIQDVWISHKGKPPRKVTAGTTIRFFDPVVGTWHCIWISPLHRVVRIFTAGKVGAEIVLEGTDRAGVPERWIFSQITPRSFRWRAVEFDAEKKTWRLTEEMRMRRIGRKDQA
jgi:hypothetical protein